jgi:hypothetical protein
MPKSYMEENRLHNNDELVDLQEEEEEEDNT